LFSHPFTFARTELGLREARYAFLGIPYDSSESYRVGSRFAPLAIREASMEMEDYDLLEGADMRDIKIADLGDLDVSFGNYSETMARVKDVVKDILAAGAIPLCVGGEHSITYSILSAYTSKEKPFILIYDAHMDFRSDYLGERFSHACVTRRLSELVGIENLLVVGVRSASRGETEKAKKVGLQYIPYPECRENLAEKIKTIAGRRNIYISFDFDVLDPAEARGVGNPEPLGLGFEEILSSLNFLFDNPMVGFDLTEVTPIYDTYTPVLAAKLIFKVLLKAEKIKKYKSHGD
jgi:agmatinase